MEVEKLISSLDETIAFLRDSETSDYSQTSVENIIASLGFELMKIRNSQPIDTRLLSLLYAPTGAIQETAMDNGWSQEYLRISEVIDRFTVGK